MRRISSRIAKRSHAGQNSVQMLGFASQSILRLFRMNQERKDALALGGETVGQIRSSHGLVQPVHRQTYPFLLQQKRTSRPVCFPDLHVITSRNHQVGGPGYPCTQSLEHGRGGLSDAITMLAARLRVRKRRTDAIATISQPSRYKARAREGMKDSQQARLRNSRHEMQVMQRRIRLHLQRLKHPQSALQTLDDLRHYTLRHSAFRN